MLRREGRLELAETCFRFLPDRAKLDLAGWAAEPTAIVRVWYGIGSVLAPLAAEDLAFAPIPAPLDLEQRRAMAAMKETVVAIAAQFGLPEGLLCARRHMETLLTESAWPAALEGWRRPILHDALMAQMP